MNWAWRTFLVLLLACGLSRTASAEWCGASDEENWRELYSLYTAEQSRGPDRPVIFIMGAPWCPYCAQLLKMLQTKRYSFDVQLVPVSAINELHKDQLADLVMDGTQASIVRVFEQRRADISSITPEQRQFVNDVQLATAIALNLRFAERGKNFGLPTTLYWSHAGMRASSGMPNPTFIEENIAATGDHVSRARTRRFLKTGVPKPRPVAGTPYANKHNVRVRLLPDDTAFTAMCLNDGFGFPSAQIEIVEVDGKQWLAVHAIKEHPRAVFYVLARDLDGWSQR
jgi:hypothetical protein